MYTYAQFKAKTHRVIPSRYPTVSVFDWAESPEEIEELALLEGMTNDRIQNELGNIQLITKEDWVLGEGATPLMAPFTHPGYSRFTDGSYGVYYASDSLQCAVAESKFHRQLFLKASNETACLIQMREYIARVIKKLVNIKDKKYKPYLNPDLSSYANSQKFARELKQAREWGLMYPSVRHKDATCFAIFRPPALSIPVQGCHLEYIWDGEKITETNVLKAI